MALKFNDRYPGRSNEPNADYPYGSARDVSQPGARDGTPLQADWVNDLQGFLQDLMTEAEIEPSGNPDKAGASQYADALRAAASKAGAGTIEQQTGDQDEHNSPAGVEKLPRLDRMTAATGRAYSKAVGSQAEHSSPSGVDKVPTLGRMALLYSRPHITPITLNGAGEQTINLTNVPHGGTVVISAGDADTIQSITADTPGKHVTLVFADEITVRNGVGLEDDQIITGIGVDYKTRPAHANERIRLMYEGGQWHFIDTVEDREVVTLGGDFDAGMEVICSRINNRVTITSATALTTTTKQSPGSAVGAIPSRFHGGFQTWNVYNMAASHVARAGIQDDGRLVLDEIDWSGSRQSISTSRGVVSISYVLPDGA